MAWVFDGTYRYQKLVVTKWSGTTPVAGYPKYYSILDEFEWDSVTYGELLPFVGGGTALGRLSVADYNTRLSAFRNYLEDLETGLVLPDDESNLSSGTDVITCVIGGGYEMGV